MEDERRVGDSLSKLQSSEGESLRFASVQADIDSHGLVDEREALESSSSDAFGVAALWTEKKTERGGQFEQLESKRVRLCYSPAFHPPGRTPAGEMNVAASV